MRARQAIEVGRDPVLYPVCAQLYPAHHPADPGGQYAPVQLAAAAERVFEFLDEPEEDQTGGESCVCGWARAAVWNLTMYISAIIRIRSLSTISAAKV